MITALALFFGLFVGFFLFVFGLAELARQAGRPSPRAGLPARTVGRSTAATDQPGADVGGSGPMSDHDDQYDAGHADGFAEGRREADVTGHLLRPHARHMLDEVLEGWSSCERCAAVRSVLEDLLP